MGRQSHNLVDSLSVNFLKMLDVELRKQKVPVKFHYYVIYHEEYSTTIYIYVN